MSTDGLGCRAAPGKGGLVSSCKKVASRAAASLGEGIVAADSRPRLGG